MICPHCQSQFETAPANCPECGIRIVRKISGIVKTSTVMIAAGEESTFYRSVQDVPESLRRQLIETTNSENSGMIVIADRAGKEQWTEIVARREAQQAQAAPVEPVIAAETIPAARGSAGLAGLAGLSWAAWAGIMLLLAAAALIASAFQIVRW
jgi:hypothetical protein